MSFLQILQKMVIKARKMNFTRISFNPEFHNKLSTTWAIISQIVNIRGGGGYLYETDGVFLEYVCMNLSLNNVCVIIKIRIQIKYLFLNIWKQSLIFF